ncbi:phage shock protein operon transcriptional activator [Kiloniella majae]|uniref:phage shock protein operon transcriptional activator n=1 Tax=Kiloniella majae TaxID=1938558 RepID=UPI000A27880A|nr:phage shock protein operon transcriptional activator [Kiloniella majae]
MDALVNIIGEDPHFLDVVEKASQLALIDKPCLVVGERGTGKELFTSRLHYLSRRWDGPLVKINCAALTDSLLESELFGHERGAFTGAQRTHIGRFERADGGTLILDEIATASSAVQEKVLRVIEYGEFERVGGSETLHVDVRVIGAANVDLPALAAEGTFRADLLDRLAFDVLTLPPLRVRPRDILTLAHHFALEVTREVGRDLFPGFSARAKKQLIDYAWPGNVRELKNAVERTICRLPVTETAIDEIYIDPFDSPWRFGGGKRKKEEAVEIESVAIDDFAEAVADFERGILTQTLERYQFNQTDAAQALSLSYHQLRRLLKKYEVSVRSS